MMHSELRTDFARSLQAISCTTLSTLDLSYRYEDPTDQRFVNADVRGIDVGSTSDILSVSLHQLVERCPQLKVLRPRGPICVDEKMFGTCKTDTAKGGWLR